MQKISFISEDNILIGNLYGSNNKVGALILHGGGKAAKERFRELQEYLSNHGFTSLAFDFRGVGESQGTFEDGSLINRLKDAEAAFDEFKKYTKKIVVIGCSMGGHIAARLTVTRDVSGLILLYSAAYSQEAEDKPLNEEFTKILRKEDSWQNSPAFSAVKNYKGNVLVMYGENDTVIPKEVQNTYKETTKDKGRFVILPHASHLFLSPDTLDQESKHQAFTEILSFCHQNN